MAELNQDITMNYFLDELKKKVSPYNAKLLLQTAVVRSGVNRGADAPLAKEDVHALCMELLRSGGPGFQVGRTVYTQVLR